MANNITIDPLVAYQEARNKLSAHDEALLVEASRTGWEEMGKYADQCESDWARNRIHAMMKDRYHREND